MEGFLLWRKKSLTIEANLSRLFSQPKATKAKSVYPTEHIERGMTIVQALNTVIHQMEVSGYRARTIYDYGLHVNHFAEVTGVKYLDEITSNHIYADFEKSMSRVSALSGATDSELAQSWSLNRCG